MPARTNPTPHSRSRQGRLVGGLLALGLLTAPVLAAPTASADSAVKPDGGSFSVSGAGFGHGHGMSQYGAYGAAKKGLSWKKILAFYYPGTQRATLPAGQRIHVWLTADDDDSLRVRPAAGLKVSDRDGHSLTLPAGGSYTSWRISRSGSGYRLAYRNASGTWKTRTTDLTASTWTFSTPAKAVQVVLPGGTKSYRGSVKLVKRGSGGRTVNTVTLEDYARSVVPSEMPTSWLANAVNAQAVAARSYAVYLRDVYHYTGYDICDTTACQVYGGMARENSGGDAAVKATAGVVLTYQDQPALTQFAASDGGATAKSNLPYLTAHPDPYDGVITSQAWHKTITAKSVAHAWPSVGTVKKLQVTKRDGSGRYGGRVTSIKIIGSKKSVTVSGGTFQSRFGMRSSLFKIS
ncbi:SpoIID/LytB domain-containing protein [uncultured Friedmanniella sp.]|uniref:SpoIID/LytB domain-containing protein n=1 Tax=uncultured Friedmanniella sp. TaxID=335381 RepID=UPI0035C9BEC7